MNKILFINFEEIIRFNKPLEIDEFILELRLKHRLILLNK